MVNAIIWLPHVKLNFRFSNSFYGAVWGKYSVVCSVLSSPIPASKTVEKIVYEVVLFFFVIPGSIRDPVNISIVYTASISPFKTAEKIVNEVVLFFFVIPGLIRDPVNISTVYTSWIPAIKTVVRIKNIE